MANEQNVSETVLKYRVAGVAETARAADQVKRGQQQLTAEIDKLSPTSKRNVDSVRRDFGRMETDLKEARALVRSLQDELDTVGKTKVTPKISVDDEFSRVSRDVALAGDVQSNLGAVRGLADTAGLGGVGSGIGVAGELVVLVEELPRLKTALTGLPDAARKAWAALGTEGQVALGVVGGLAVVIGVLQQTSDRTAGAIRARLQVERELAEFLENANRQELLDRIATTERAVAFERAQYQQLQAEAEQAVGLGDILASLFSTQALGETIGASTAYSGALADQAQKVKDAQRELAGLTLAAENHATANTDAALARAAAEQTEASAIQQTAQARLQAEVFAATATNDSVNARIDAYQRENRVLTEANTELLASGTEAALALYNQNTAQIALNNTQIEATNAIRGQVAAQQALTSIVGGVADLASGIVDGIRAIPKAAADFKKQADVVTAALARVDQEERRHADAMVAIRTDLAAKEQAIMADAREQAGALGDKFGVEQKRAVEDLEDELARIRSRGALGEQQAAQARNAVVFDQARTQAEQEETEAEKQAGKLDRRRDEDYRRELQQLVVATNKRLTAERDAANKQLTLEAHKYSAEIALRRQALTAAQTQFAQYVNGLLSTGATGYQVALNQFGVFINGLIGRASGGLTSNGQPLPGTTVPYPPAISSGGSSVTGTGIQPYTRTAAIGGWRQGLTLVNDGTGGMRGIESATTSDKQVIYFDRPTRVNNARETDALRGGGFRDAVVNLSGLGLTPRQVGQMVERALEDFAQGFEETA